MDKQYTESCVRCESSEIAVVVQRLLRVRLNCAITLLFLFLSIDRLCPFFMCKLLTRSSLEFMSPSLSSQGSWAVIE